MRFVLPLAVLAVLAGFGWWDAGLGWIEDRAPWAFEMPRGWQVPFSRWIGGFVTWLTREAALGPLAFSDLTRGISAVIAAPYDLVLALLSRGFGPLDAPVLPPMAAIAVLALTAIAGLYARGPGLALFALACLGAIGLAGQWDSAMVTLASVLIAVPIGVAGGLATGLLAHRWRWFSAALRPVLDLMQTMPVFAYLVPILILFGFSPVSAIIATVIYALPPMTRVTELALSRVAPEIRDLGRMVGCTPRQMTWRVMLPAARDGLMVGVNQVIMLSLNMVIIASMIGAGGLGFDVLTALRQLDFDAGVAAGLAIVLLAIALDRLSQAAAARSGGAQRRGPWVARHPYLVAALATILVGLLIGLLLPGQRGWSAGLTLSTGDWWARQMEWINTSYFDQIEAAKDWVLLNLMVPLRRFLLGLPWVAVVALTGLGGLALGGWRLGLLTLGLALFVALTGLWEQAMMTVYLCGLATVLAMLIGVPVGILAAEARALWPPIRAVIDTAQTLPSFVYLMPAVMLFRVGEFTALLAVVVFAVAPAIRFTATGLMAVDPALVEAGRAMGCTRLQLLTRIKLRMAAPEILLGLNQTIMAALAMLVITALVGTRDLGQEVYVALTRANAGDGLVAGLCVAAIAIIADRLVMAGAARLRAGVDAGGAHG